MDNALQALLKTLACLVPLSTHADCAPRAASLGEAGSAGRAVARRLRVGGAVVDGRALQQVERPEGSSQSCKQAAQSASRRAWQLHPLLSSRTPLTVHLASAPSPAHVMTTPVHWSSAQPAQQAPPAAVLPLAVAKHAPREGHQVWPLGHWHVPSAPHSRAPAHWSAAQPEQQSLPYATSPLASAKQALREEHHDWPVAHLQVLDAPLQVMSPRHSSTQPESEQQSAFSACELATRGARHSLRASQYGVPAGQPGQQGAGCIKHACPMSVQCFQVGRAVRILHCLPIA